MDFEITKDYVGRVLEALADESQEELLDELLNLHPADVAQIVEAMDGEQAKLLFQHLDAPTASEVMTHLDPDEQTEYLKSFTSGEIAQHFIENVESDDAADIVNLLPVKQRAEVIGKLDDIEQASDIVDLLNYEEGTAGALMGKEMIAVKQSLKVKDCVREVRAQAEGIDSIYTVYVTNDDEKLLGRLSLKMLLLSSDDILVKHIYKPDIEYVHTHTTSEAVAQIMEKYDLIAVPVVDELGRLVGRITIDDVVDVIREEAERDYQMASGISSSVDTDDTVFDITKARLPWLLLGLAGGVFGALVIGHFEGQLQLHPEMAFFIPLIAAMGGNVGVQSSAIIVQGLASGSLSAGITSKLSKEFLVALVNGLACSGIILVYNLLVSDSLNLAFTVSLSLMSVIMFAGLFGTFVPLILHRYKVDPALATGPFITTVNDILGLYIYFVIGTLLYA